MPDSQVDTFTLVPHATTQGPVACAITGKIFRSPAGLRVSYFLEGDIARLRVPLPQPPRFADELWRHTCFELFIASKGESSYHEFNFSPSGEWAVYAFARYRERVPLAGSALTALTPDLTVLRSAASLRLDAVVPIDRIEPHHADAGFVIGLSAVIESNDDALSYWALAHPSARPDFHHADALVLELDEIRN